MKVGLMDRLESVLRYIVIVLLAVMVVVVFCQIVFRYLFNSPLGWSEEVTRYLFIYITFLGAAIGIRKNIHVGLDILSERLTGKAKRVLLYTVNGLVMVFLAIVTYLGVKLSLNGLHQASPALGIPIGLAYIAIPVGALMSIFFLIEALVVAWREGQG